MKMIVKRPNGTKRVYTINEEPSMTDQSWQNECDVNHIMAKFKKTGQVTHLNAKAGVYADVSEIPDLLGAMQQVQDADKAFASLPAKLREKFGNSPLQMVNFLQDPSNLEESYELGLRIRPKTSAESSPRGKQAEGALSKKAKQKNSTDDDSGEDLS